MKNSLKISTLFALIVFVTFGVNAQQRTAAPYAEKQMRYEKKSMLPDLSDDQKDQMKAIHIKTMKEVQPLKNSLMEKKAHLNTLSTVAAADMRAINKQIDEISDIQASIQKTRAASNQEVRNLLTEDQRVIFDTKHAQKMNRQGGKELLQKTKRMEKGHQGGHNK